MPPEHEVAGSNPAGRTNPAMLVSRAGAVSAPASPLRGPVAQLAEQQTLNLLVLGSIPSGLTTFLKTKGFFPFPPRFLAAEG